MLDSQEPTDRRSRVTRIDPAHPLRSQYPPPSAINEREVSDVVSGEEVAQVDEQLRHQAGQLARHLRVKQQQIDHREAQLNARIAHLEREARTSRMWYSEREHASTQREQAWQHEIAELQIRMQAFAAEEVASLAEREKHAEQLRDREAELTRREQRLWMGQRQVAEEAESLRVALERFRADRARHEDQLVAQRQQLEHQTAQLREQERRLLANLQRQRQTLEEQERRIQRRHEELGLMSERDLAEVSRRQQSALLEAASLLDEQTRQLAEERQQFEHRQTAATEQIRQQQDVLRRQKHEAEQRIAELRTKLAARRAVLDQRRLALEQMKQQVHELHRDSIEMRLAAEQLWQHAVQGRPLTELTQSLGFLRAKLTDEFRLSHEELVGKESQLKVLADKLSQRQLQVEQQQRELQEWLQRRHDDLQAQATRLLNRETELDAQQQSLLEREAAWREERQRWQAQLRRLHKPNTKAPLAA